jgi:putative ABC transport system substrate-binding protein
MRRREFITLLGGAAATWPLAAGAQVQQKMARIGYLGAGIRTVSPNPREAFLQGLRDLGYVEGQNFVLVDRYADGQQERLPELAVELVRLEVDIIVAPTSGSAKAAKDATRTIPIVMAAVGDPVGLGLVASLARPGGNVTGPSMMNTEIIGKRMQLLKEVVPGLVRVAVLANSVNPIHAIFWRESEPAARELGLELQLSKRAYRRTLRWHSRQPREARLARSSPSMMRSHITIEPGSLR